MKFPIKKVNLYGQFEIEALEFNEFVSRHYKQLFNVYEDQNAQSGVSLLFKVHKKDLYGFESRLLADFILDGFYNDLTEIIFKNLLLQDIIQEGNYLILT